MFTEIALDGQWSRRGRIDVAAITVKPNYEGILVDGYEVKCSRNDFFTDVQAMKWRKYLSVCDRVVFVTPPGLVTKDDVPDGAGLAVWTAKNTLQTVVRAPRHNPERDDADLLMRTIWRRAGTNGGETRSERLRKLAADDQALARHLSQRARRLIMDAQIKTDILESERRDLEKRRERLEQKALRAEGAPQVLEALSEVLLVGRDALGASDWQSEERVQAARELIDDLAGDLRKKLDTRKAT